MAISLSKNKHTAPRVKARLQRQARGRKKTSGTAERPRLVVTRSAKHISVQVVDDLAGFARPYLSRLWARLHGRDVWQEPCTDVDDVRAVLEGVARSVSLDHRQRIKAMLDEAVTS